MNWEIIYYDTPSGQEVIKDFIDDLQENTQAKLGRQLDLLEEHGNRLGMPHAKAKGTWQTRSEDILCFCGGQAYLLTAWFRKENPNHS